MSRKDSVVFVTAHGRDLIARRGWSTRPAQLARAVAQHGIQVVIVARTAPWRSLAALSELRWRPGGGSLVLRAERDPGDSVQLIEHPFPAGRLEALAIRDMLRHLPAMPLAIVVEDPRSAPVLEGVRATCRVFDAYDAWDLSPLYRTSPRRIAAIQEGYHVAAGAADLVTANTPAMVERMRSLGAQRVHLLPNGAPPVGGSGREHESGRDVLYLGNIQTRIRVDLLLAAAEAAAASGGLLRIVGSMQVPPPEWDRVSKHPAIAHEGPRFGAALEDVFVNAAVGIVPHEVSPYTISQDAMKAWDYLARGLPVVSTGVPPASSVSGLAVVADDAESFGGAVRRLLETPDLDSSARGMELARRNGWYQRAGALLELIEACASHPAD